LCPDPWVDLREYTPRNTAANKEEKKSSPRGVRCRRVSLKAVETVDHSSTAMMAKK